MINRKMNKIVVKPYIRRFYKCDDIKAVQATWTDPRDGVKFFAIGTTQQDALRHLYSKFKTPIHVNDMTIPLWKFWKRKYIK